MLQQLNAEVQKLGLKMNSPKTKNMTNIVDDRNVKIGYMITERVTTLEVPECVGQVTCLSANLPVNVSSLIGSNSPSPHVSLPQFVFELFEDGLMLL